MSMPELPGGFYWKVAAVGPETVTVSLYSDDNHPAFPSLGGESVSVKGLRSKEAIVEQVEAAAHRVHGALCREIYLRSIIQENWP